MNIVNHKSVSYFDNLPRYAIPIVQTAWDKASGGQFGFKFIFKQLCSDLAEVGHEPMPSSAQTTSWISDIQNGKIKRPEIVGDETVPEAQPALADAGTIAVPVGVVDSANIDDAMRSVADALVDAEVERLQAGIREQARRIVAGQFRAIADAMEGAAR